MRTNFALRITEPHHAQLKGHLFPGDGKEAVALLLCGRRKGQERHVLTVQGGDGFFGIFQARHGDKGKPFGLTRGLIRNHSHRGDISKPLERSAKDLFRHVVGQIANVNVRHQDSLKKLV